MAQVTKTLSEFILSNFPNILTLMYNLPKMVKGGGGNPSVSLLWYKQGAEMCVWIKRVCVKFTEPKVCTVDIYSTYESRYLYSLGVYMCILLIVYLKINKFNIHVMNYVIMLVISYLSMFVYLSYHVSCWPWLAIRSV